MKNKNCKVPLYWTSQSGGALLRSHEAKWTVLLGEKLYLANSDGSRFQISGAGDRYTQVRNWWQQMKAASGAEKLCTELAATALNLANRWQNGNATIADPPTGDWPTLNVFVDRASSYLSQHSASAEPKYLAALEETNRNRATITPPDAGGCDARRK